jgi:NDP-sugar pyrophosphorylase family protein
LNSDSRVLCLGHKGNIIEKAIREYDLDANIIFSDAGRNGAILKQIVNTKDYIADKAIMPYGDTFANIDLRKLLDEHVNMELRQLSRLPRYITLLTYRIRWE